MTNYTQLYKEKEKEIIFFSKFSSRLFFFQWLMSDWF